MVQARDGTQNAGCPRENMAFLDGGISKWYCLLLRLAILGDTINLV